MNPFKLRYQVLLGSLLLAGCATSVFNPATSVPMTKDTPPGMGAPQDIVGEYGIALSFSGGGLRAAAFTQGVLEALRQLKTPGGGDLLDDVTFISSVSGGSLTAANFGLHGRDGMERFRNEVLLQDFERDMNLSVLNPGNVLRLLGGGLNDRRNFGDSLDKRVFKGATFADIYRHGKPDVRIHATDLYHRISFPFIPRVFSIMCSDIRPYSVADAVAASMAVPLVFAPVVVRTFPGHCTEPVPGVIEATRANPDAPRVLRSTAQAMMSYRESSRPQYIRLVDGGLTDNYGLTTVSNTRSLLNTPYAPMTRRDAVKVRRMLFLVIDASRGPNGDWAFREEGLGGVDQALYAIDAATDASARLAADAFGNMVKEWERGTIEFRCGLSQPEVESLGGPPRERWHCADLRFTLAFLSFDRLDPERRQALEAIPTRLSLPKAQVDAAVEGGRAGTLALPSLAEYLRERMN